MDELVLSSENDKDKLIIVIKNGNWSEVYIEHEKKRIKLGSQGLDNILYGIILSFLNIRERSLFQYLDYNLFTIVNLMDSHSVIAGRYIKDKLELYHLETRGKLQYLLSLNELSRINFIKDVCKKII